MPSTRAHEVFYHESFYYLTSPEQAQISKCSVSCIRDRNTSNESFSEVRREQQIQIYSNQNVIGGFGDETCRKKRRPPQYAQILRSSSESSIEILALETPQLLPTPYIHYVHKTSQIKIILKYFA
jgi:hypothetical protein